MALKFRKHWELNVNQEWESEYVRFHEIEEMLDEAEKNKFSTSYCWNLLASQTSIDSERFFNELTAELKKVNNFKDMRERQLIRKLSSIKAPKRKKDKKKSFAEVSKDVGEMIMLYDELNKLKSFAVLNRQAFEALIQRWDNLHPSHDHQASQNFRTALMGSSLCHTAAIEAAQNELERRGLGGVISSGVRRPTRLEQNIVDSSLKYVAWLQKNLPCAIVKEDVAHKHRCMAEDPFMFLRATFYRWVQLWPVICPGLSAAPHVQVLAIGDLHVENYGTWRDREGRWVWGVNDFDEAFPMAYTIDLVRLSTSAVFAHAEHQMTAPIGDLLERLIKGYKDSIMKGGDPVVLETSAKDPQRYWKKLTAVVSPPSVVVPREIHEALLKSLPDGAVPVHFAHRQAGLGSLGRPRFMLLAKWKGGFIARECKPAVPSACYFAANHPGPYELRVADIIALSRRCPDPFFRVDNGWLYRRLTPEAGKISLSKRTAEEELELFYWMGWELGNVHNGSKHAIENVKADLESRPKGWLLSAAIQMKEAVEQDWRMFRSHIASQSSLPTPGARAAL